jgi:hypothetical protein
VSRQGLGSRTAQWFRAGDGRTIGLLVPSDFDDFDSFPPYVNTEEERQHLLTAYEVSDPERERHTKAHITDNDLPLQVIVLQRDKSAITKPHYHVQEAPAHTRTRHEILVCMRGSARCEIYSTDGELCGNVMLRSGDLLLMYEGHAVEFVEDGTKLIEIKQGPMPPTETEDKTDLR